MSKARNLADLLSDGAELADGQISVAEVVGAAPLASPTFTGTASGTFSGPLTGNVTGNLTGNVTGAVTGDVTAPEIDLTAISSTIADTAVDVFVYDTRKDSDGGAWRKRTQGTSWYNETLNTSTRGSRKEFPSVAVIVAESNQVTIYDGDDPDLPMWKTGTRGGSGVWTSTIGGDWNIKAVSAANGNIAVLSTHPSYSGYGSANVYSFVDDTYYRYSSGGDISSYKFYLDYSNGNTSAVSSLNNIVSNFVNDVAMTVLPNAPIDAATGLPVPTIAVATNGGVSVIKDDGTVVNITESSSSTNNTGNVQFLDNNKLVFRADGNTSYKWSGRVDIPSSTRTYSYLDEGTMLYVMYGGGASSSRLMLTPPYSGDASTATTAYASYKNNVVAGTIKGFGQGTTDPTQNDTVNTNLVNYTSSSYNTGWMNGDIKLATLSDTDDTDVTGTDYFSSIVDGDWTLGTGVTVSSGDLTLSNATGSQDSFFSITSPVGSTLVVEFTVANAVAGAVGIYLTGDSGGGVQAYKSASGTYSETFSITSTTQTVRFRTNGTTTLDVTNISVRLAEKDRSVNGNGLQVFGTVTKNPVATGADLVASYHSSGHYMQPYNSDFDFGTGDFCHMFWAKWDGTTTFDFLTRQARSGSAYGSSSGWYHKLDVSGAYLFGIIPEGGSPVASTLDIDASGFITEWTHITVVRRNGVVSIYRNGEFKDSDTNTTSINNTAQDSVLYVGTIMYGSSENTRFKGSLALVRISATAPSPEQIKKIYEDEKVLFQDNAQATLYGSSDAVTALAYDDSTELLHVGTSAGRSVFQGLRRVDNTTTAVGAAISASNGLVADE